jgi:hypothetical protein
MVIIGVCHKSLDKSGELFIFQVRKTRFPPTFFRSAVIGLQKGLRYASGMLHVGTMGKFLMASFDALKIMRDNPTISAGKAKSSAIPWRTDVQVWL